MRWKRRETSSRTAASGSAIKTDFWLWTKEGAAASRIFYFFRSSFSRYEANPVLLVNSLAACAVRQKIGHLPSIHPASTAVASLIESCGGG
jgi:hypothetical protein